MRINILLLSVGFVILVSCEKDRVDKTIPTNVNISQVKVTAVPEKDSHGSRWDEFSSPDLYFKLFKNYNGKQEIHSSYVKDNCSSYPASWKPDVELNTSEFQQAVTLDLMDQDTPDSDDKIAELSFDLVNKYATGTEKYPPTITVTENNVTITLTLEWKYQN